MDFFHCPIKIISRNKGRSAVAASAYIRATRMENTWDGATHDYTRKRHVIYSEVMQPEHAPPKCADRNVLWNSVEWNQKARDAQLARTVELALPTELTNEQNIALIRRFVQETFVNKGMCADVAFHHKGDGNPHVHIMLTMRALQENGRWAPKSRLVYNLDANGLMVIMSDYHITDAASHADAVKQANAKFYELRSRRKENADLSSVYEREHEFELNKYRQADDALKRWEADGERIDYKGWQTVMKHLNKERFSLDFELREQKENIRRLEVVKREFIRERKRRSREKTKDKQKNPMPTMLKKHDRYRAPGFSGRSQIEESWRFLMSHWVDEYIYFQMLHT